MIRLAHGDLNEANILIDALDAELDAVWMIDFATAVDLPLFTDMCKFEMACLFEYAVIPVTPTTLLEFCSRGEGVWKGIQAGEWLKFNDDIGAAPLQALCALPPNHLAQLSAFDIGNAIVKAIVSDALMEDMIPDEVFVPLVAAHVEVAWDVLDVGAAVPVVVARSTLARGTILIETPSPQRWRGGSGGCRAQRAHGEQGPCQAHRALRATRHRSARATQFEGPAMSRLAGCTSTSLRRRANSFDASFT